ncbi:sortase family protein [Corynebacterium singulare]|uniref:Sortase family enzyme n=1 Tax=Corynebacterium singulare TaxID=161899 RepID=A0A0B6EZ38_9CORY|nr:hypothetical protein [Corynebacterium singulare]AJI78204.1 sortase family enzyme [Corynebacterium singulare]
MDSRYSAQRDSYRLPEEGIRIDLSAERARRRSRSRRNAAASAPERRSPQRRSSAPTRSRSPRPSSPRLPQGGMGGGRVGRRQAQPRHRKPANHRGLGLAAILVVVLVGIVAAVLLNHEPETPASQPPADIVAEPATIAPSPAVEMYIPSIDVRAEFEEESCRVKDNKINPDSMSKACTYTADDKPYALPGTDSPDIVVIAGHTGAGVPAVFNNLYDGRADEHKASIGDKLYLRTEKSGEQWLVYTATDLHDPSKDGLEQDTSIWGEDPMPGRLLTISCIQPANLLAAAVRNAVVGWQFEGVTSTPDPTA